MNLPEMKPVQSSQMAAIGYDAANQRLFARFNPKKDGSFSTYAYEGVGVEVWQSLNVEGVSVGTTFNSLVRGKYEYANLGQV